MSTVTPFQANGRRHGGLPASDTLPQMGDLRYPIGEFEAPAEIHAGQIVGIYAWHGRHHLAHVENLARRRGWLDGGG